MGEPDINFAFQTLTVCIILKKTASFPLTKQVCLYTVLPIVSPSYFFQAQFR